MSGQAALFLLLALLFVAAVVVTVAVVRHAPRSRAAELVDRGDFDAALAAGGRPEDRRAAATASRHLLRFDAAAALLDDLLDDEPDDGEALVERGLVAAYTGRFEDARRFLERAARVRADLAESITLHRAWLELRAGQEAAARRLFEEIDAPLESKLRGDLAGDPLFAEWFLHAALLWRAAGDRERAEWAWREGLAAAPESRLAEALSGDRARADGG